MPAVPDIRFADLRTCERADGTVVVVDVLRAFTTAAYAFAAGAAGIVPVGTVTEALHLRDAWPGSLAMGEVHGLPVDSFDLPNSPTAVERVDLTGRRLIHRTTAGTQGIVRSVRAQRMIAASFVVAAATVAHLRALRPVRVTFVVTGTGEDGGDEDRSCAEYLAARLRGERPDAAAYVARVRRCADARKFLDPAQPEYPSEDVPVCAQLDLFDFAMPVRVEDGHPVLRPAYAGP